MELGADGPSNGQSSRISRGSNGAVTDQHKGNQPLEAALTPDFAARMGDSVRFQWPGILSARPAGFGFP